MTEFLIEIIVLIQGNWLNRFTVVSVYRVYSSSLSPLFAAIADDFSFYRFLCTAYGTGGAVPWSQNADIDMDQ